MAIDSKGGPPRPALATDTEREDVREVAEILARKWYLDVLTQLQQDGPYRFNELKRELGVTPKVLTDCLSELTQRGLVDRTVYSESPPHVEYGLAERGYELQRIAAEMAAWTDDPDTTPTILVVDAVVSTNIRFSEWLSEDYTVERVTDTAHLDDDHLHRADVVLYHHDPLLADESRLVDRIQDGSLDVGVIHVTAHRRSSTRTHGRAVELVEPILKDELLQATRTAVETADEA
ncbi:transcriptional regulator, HxlR family [Halogranum rubrum]|uniref:Transcriptional regulator, HxlR family n=1 Tax=Halogranum rubrum TaxID=553466 RepID=A0A1I4BXU1_9EURY|nr:helix-turn-helix domain-containing protein [Halogranum rubrum]SFK73582.1 transcriptional regulator, HxlR family [Halogranum rubrum]